MLPLILLSQGRGKTEVRFLPLLCVMALLDTVAAVLLFAAGKTAHPELATVCGTASGAITVVLAWIFLSERIVYLRWCGIAATFIGIAALSALK